MSAQLVEIRWTPELCAALVRWILNDAQLPALDAADIATPEMVALTALRRERSARMKLTGLRTLLEAGRVAVLDCDVIEAMDRLQLANGREVPPC